MTEEQWLGCEGRVWGMLNFVGSPHRPRGQCPEVVAVRGRLRPSE
jgi:hypothetical protein